MSESEFVTRRELDYRLTNIEQRIENKMDRMLAAIDMLATDMNAKFKIIDNDINWLKWISLASAGFIIAAASKFLFH